LTGARGKSHRIEPSRSSIDQPIKNGKGATGYDTANYGFVRFDQRGAPGRGALTRGIFSFPNSQSAASRSRFLFSERDFP
jgi:hypothetical protein